MDTKNIIQMLYYIIKNGKKSYDKVSLLKLVFFSDRYHLRKYGRSISHDTYYAMKHGAVASNVKDILSQNFESDEEQEYFFNYISISDNKYYITNKEKSLEMLSKTNEEAMDFALKHFGNIETFKLAEISHQYPEWKKMEQLLAGGLKRQKMDIIDFFLDSKIKDDPYQEIPQDIVEMSKDFYLGKF
ncbi:SocA family protein [Campylobacter coli]|nr:SocA family protein [Campylobacter coli]